MNPIVPAIGNMASALNGLGIWRGQQSVWGHRIRSKTFDRSLYLWMHKRGLMGAGERAVLSRLVQPGMTVVDVGANLGLYSLLFAALVGPTGRVISFEPDPDLFSLLRDNCAANGADHVEPRHLALGNTAARMVLNRMTLNSGDNHLGSNGGAAFRKPVEVEVAALDVLMPRLRPHFIKVDVQGWELNVLRGMERTIRESETASIYIEFWPEGLRRAGASPADLYSFVRSLGLRFYSCDGWEELNEGGFLALAQGMRGHTNLLATRIDPKLFSAG
jgi:FkbM family methyltransferase